MFRARDGDRQDEREMRTRHGLLHAVRLVVGFVGLLELAAHVAPAEVAPEAVDLGAVVPHEEDEVLDGDGACRAAGGLGAGLGHLR